MSLRGLCQRLRRIAEEQESGQGMTEFVIIFPVQLFLILAIVQFSLINMATVVVNQAAFRAARAYLVFDVREDSLASGPGLADDIRMDRAKKAAAFVLSTVSGSEIQGVADISYPPASGPRPLFRYGEAFENTTVEAGYFEGKRYVGAKVDHHFELSIPIANHFFAIDWSRQSSKDLDLGYLNTKIERGWYNDITRKRGSTYITLTESCYLPCPWTPGH